MHNQYGWSIAAQLKWREKTMIAKGSTSIKGCGDSLRPFASCAPFRPCDGMVQGVFLSLGRSQRK